MDDREKALAAARKKVAQVKDKLARDKQLKQLPVPIYAQMPEPTGNAEADSAADLDAVQAGFRARAKDEGRRFALATDTEYWACLCFQTREQKEVFLKALKLIELGDKYIDGQAAARVLGVELPSADIPYNTSSNINSAWAEFVD